MKILAIGAHPDDLEISCAGSLAKMVQAGHEVVLCHASDGDKGHYHIPSDELVRIRQAEAANAGRIIGCEVISLGMRDGEIVADDAEARQRFIDLFCAVKPDVVITHAPNDYMPDHVAVSKLALDMSFVATLPGASTRHTQAAKVPALYYMDNLSGIDFQPTIYVDITDTFDTKMRMLNEHQSQVTWLQEHDNIDIAEFTTTLCKFRGMQAGCAYAEGFIQHMAWTRPNAGAFPAHATGRALGIV